MCSGDATAAGDAAVGCSGVLLQALLVFIRMASLSCSALKRGQRHAAVCRNLMMLAP
jgi:hypothetical protein